MLRRVGFIATLATGVGLLGASLHGITSVDHELRLAAATPATAPATQREVVQEGPGRGCDKRQRHHTEV